MARETRSGETDGLVTHLLEFYRNHDPLPVPSPEIPSILRELGGRYRLGLLSDGYLGSPAAYARRSETWSATSGVVCLPIHVVGKAGN